LRSSSNYARIAFSVLFSLACYGQSFGGHEDPESFRIEVTAGGWLINSGGQIQANGSPIDLVNDLGVSQNKGTFYGQFVFKPGRKHRIVVEGTPFQLNGLKTVSRTINYRGQTFTVNQTVQSTATLDYFFAGYQYDVLSGPKGHLGFSVGGAYLNASGSLSTVPASVSASRSQTVGLPLAGVDFRLFPIPHRKIFDVEGGIRGMAYGDYGYYAEATGSGGLNLGPFAILAGYRAVNTSIYVNNSGGPSGLTARLKGPIFSGVFRW
jgi:hypothetical protein